MSYDEFGFDIGAAMKIERRGRGRPAQTHTDPARLRQQAYQAQYHIDKYHGDPAWQAARREKNRLRYHRRKADAARATRQAPHE